MTRVNPHTARHDKRRPTHHLPKMDQQDREVALFLPAIFPFRVPFFI